MMVILSAVAIALPMKSMALSETNSDGTPNGSFLAVPKATIVTNSDGSYTVDVPTANGTVETTIPAPVVGATLQNVVQQVLNNTNLLWEAHALYAPGLQKKYGGGIGVVYPFSQYVFTSVRIDWVNGGFWMPQGNVGLQAPLTLYTNGSSKIVVTPFAYAGVAVPVSGATIGSITLGGAPPISNNGQPTAILGAGAAVNLYSPWHLNLVGDIEEWTGFPGKQIRGGFTIHI